MVDRRTHAGRIANGTKFTILAGAILLLVAMALSLRIRADLHSDEKLAIMSPITEGEDSE